MCVCVREGVRTAWLKLGQDGGPGEAFSRLLRNGCRDTRTLGGQSGPEGPAQLLEAGGAAQLQCCSVQPAWVAPGS